MKKEILENALQRQGGIWSGDVNFSGPREGTLTVVPGFTAEFHSPRFYREWKTEPDGRVVVIDQNGRNYRIDY